jgi:hypothetical protein
MISLTAYDGAVAATIRLTTLRQMWRAQGIPVDRQDELIAAITVKAQPGTVVGPFRIPQAIQLELPFPS